MQRHATATLRAETSVIRPSGPARSGSMTSVFGPTIYQYSSVELTRSSRTSGPVRADLSRTSDTDATECSDPSQRPLRRLSQSRSTVQLALTQAQKVDSRSRPNSKPWREFMLVSTAKTGSLKQTACLADSAVCARRKRSAQVQRIVLYRCFACITSSLPRLYCCRLCSASNLSVWCSPTVLEKPHKMCQ